METLETIDADIQMIRTSLPTDSSELNRSLGTLYFRRFKISQEPDDLDKSIKYQAQSANITFDNQMGHIDRLDSIGADFLRRYEQLGAVEDINQAVDAYFRAESVTPSSHPDKPDRLKHLGDALRCRHEYVGDPADIQRSIECHKQACALTQDNRAGEETVEAISRATIDNAMSATEIMDHLTDHGCCDITSELQSLPEFPRYSGGLGEVYKGALKDGSVVAVKTLRVLGDGQKDQSLLKNAAKELYIWSKCDHPNVMKLAGLAQVRNQIAMVSPWMVNGDLRKFLETEPNISRCSMCAQVADGVAYLHEKGIVHGDLKGLNVLVSHDHILKLTDFGNAALLEHSLGFQAGTTTKKMTVRWTAPELLDDGQFSFEADVYALGMTILEILTGRVPFHEITAERHVWNAICFRKKHPERPESIIPSNSNQGNTLWSLLTECWNYDPEARPAALAVRDQMILINTEGLRQVVVG